jgi:hypothetical protein
MACNSPLVEDFRLVREFCSMESGYIRFVLKLIDDSELHIFEHVDSNLHKTHYSYHWQDKRKTMILRWDNAPHHPEIKTFPYHLHEEENVKESEEMTFAEMLRRIEGKFKKLK